MKLSGTFLNFPELSGKVGLILLKNIATAFKIGVYDEIDANLIILKKMGKF